MLVSVPCLTGRQVPPGDTVHGHKGKTLRMDRDTEDPWCYKQVEEEDIARWRHQRA